MERGGVHSPGSIHERREMGKARVGVFRTVEALTRAITNVIVARGHPAAMR